MKVRITQRDIEGANRNGLDNPISRAIHRVLGGRWFVFGTKACEVSYPYRSTSLPLRAANGWRQFQQTGCIGKLEFCLTVAPLPEDKTKIRIEGN